MNEEKSIGQVAEELGVSPGFLHRLSRTKMIDVTERNGSFFVNAEQEWVLKARFGMYERAFQAIPLAPGDLEISLRTNDDGSTDIIINKR